MQAYLEQVFKGLVSHPDEVDVTALEEGDRVIYELRLNQSDIGRVIGKSGRTVNAIRSLLQAGSAKAGKHSRLEIIEDQAKD